MFPRLRAMKTVRRWEDIKFQCSQVTLVRKLEVEVQLRPPVVSIFEYSLLSVVLSTENKQ